MCNQINENKMENQIFKTFLVCPNCGSPRVEKEKIEESIANGVKYCRNCGTKIASTLEEALALVRDSDNEKIVDISKQYQLSKQYEEKLDNGTCAKITLSIDVDNYSESDFEEILSRFARNSRNFYMHIAETINNKLYSTNYFYVYTKKDHLRIESVIGTEPGRVEKLTEAGWSLIGIFSESKLQFMVAGETTSVLDKRFACQTEKGNA